MHTNLMTGTTVLTSDGEALGKVKEVRGGYFKVDTPMARDFWLACDAVATDAGDAVRLSFSKETLDANKQPEPAQL